MRGFIILLAAVFSLSVQAAEVLKTKSGMVNVESLAKLEHPWSVKLLPDGSLLITEKPGRLRRLADGKLSEPIAGTPKVAFKGQGGLLDVVIDPKFQDNHYIYLSFAEPAEQQPANAEVNPDPRLGPSPDRTDKVLKGGAVARAKLEGNQLQDLKVIWRQTPKTIGLGHYGAHMVFAPDGKLFITSGERQRFEPAQDLTGNLGKIIRINSDGSIPQDNPFANKSGTPPEIYSYGHRNPLGAAINPKTKQLWIHEMGPAHGDELNIIEPGKNYGWPLVSNGNNYDGTNIPDHETRPDLAPPAYYWHPAISPSGLMFYQGNHFTQWKGNAFIGALSGETLVRLTLEGNKVKNEERIPLQRRIRDVAEDADGAILLLSDGQNGELLKMTKAVK
jgi:glucose/arabinose dehydrogenase